MRMLVGCPLLVGVLLGELHPVFSSDLKSPCFSCLRGLLPCLVGGPQPVTPASFPASAPADETEHYTLHSALLMEIRSLPHKLDAFAVYS